MELNREKVLQVVVKALTDAQYEMEDSNKEIIESTRPIGDLKYFDSLMSVEVTSDCLDSLGYKDPLKFPSLFIDKDSNALTVGDVVNRILQLFK
ncbi:MAG: hypothetical protein A2W27_01145 [Deltaproteobacteria bacterium RBG_16_44_11]|nr:MAG: hypothetical protein A2W27_01145 [Deltaproteobacteria bacterium RBG_16_44_11]